MVAYINNLESAPFKTACWLCWFTVVCEVLRLCESRAFVGLMFKLETINHLWPESLKQHSKWECCPSGEGLVTPSLVL